MFLDASKELVISREELGEHVRNSWIRWARTQKNPKPSWLVPWKSLGEYDKEADRMIGEDICRLTMLAIAARNSRRESVNYDMQSFWDAQSEWSQATFGSDFHRGPIGPLKHLEKEAREAWQEEDQRKQQEEIADCLFLVVDAARRSRLTLENLLLVAFAKLEKNKSRVWPKPNGDEPAEHDRTKD